MKNLFVIVCCSFAFIPSVMAQEKPLPELYGTGTWDADSLGNHRVVVAVDKSADAVLATLDWRRRDQNPEAKNLIVVDAATGKRITNVARFEINREQGKVVFQPQTVPGQYYIYYLKNVQSGSKYYPTVTYPAFENTASDEWLAKHKLTKRVAPKLPAAEVVQYQAIDDFHSFYPMEVIATENEKRALLKTQLDNKYFLFTEDRRYPIRMTTDIPYRWIAEGKQDTFSGTADKGEYYVFQLGVWAARADVDHLQVNYSALTNAKTGEQIPASAFTCFNTGGIDVTGTVFEKDCSVEKGKVQALWIGAQVPEQLSAGVYEGTVTVSADNAETKTVDVSLTVTDNVIANHGDNEPWRHSRLRWLNSQIGFDDEVIAPYTPVVLKDKQLSILGRDIQLSETGFPASITSYFKETLTKIGTEGRALLASPMTLAADGGAWENLDFAITNNLFADTHMLYSVKALVAAYHGKAEEVKYYCDKAYSLITKEDNFEKFFTIYVRCYTKASSGEVSYARNLAQIYLKYARERAPEYVEMMLQSYAYALFRSGDGERAYKAATQAINAAKHKSFIWLFSMGLATNWLLVKGELKDVESLVGNILRYSENYGMRMVPVDTAGDIFEPILRYAREHGIEPETVERIDALVAGRRGAKQEGAVIKVNMFGDVSITVGGKELQWKTRKSKELFLHYLVAGDIGIDRNVIIDFLWKDYLYESAINNLKTTNNIIRKTLQAYNVDFRLDYLNSRYSLKVYNISSDLNTYRELAEKFAREDDVTHKAEIMSDILKIYKSDFALDMNYADFEHERTSIKQEMILNLMKLIRALAKERKYIEAKEFLSSLVLIDKSNDYGHMVAELDRFINLT